MNKQTKPTRRRPGTANPVPEKTPFPPAKAARKSSRPFPIAGIGASAGELEALRESEEHYHLFQGILRSTSDGILAVNRENEVLFANDRFVEMWMIPQEIMALKDDTRLLQYVLDQLSDPQGFLQKVQELYHSAEESFDTLYFKDGRVFERLSRPLMQEAELRGRVWSFRDVTARKQAEEALRNAEARYRVIFEQSPYGIVLQDLETGTGKTVEANEFAANQLGYTPEEFAALSVTDYEALENPMETARHMREIYHKGGDDFETLHRTKNGEIRNVRVSVKPIQLNERSFFYAIYQDITERKQAEEALAASEAELRALFAGMTDVVIVYDVDGRYVKIAPTSPASLYRPAEEMLGKTLHEILPKEQADYIVAKIRESIQSGRVVTGEYTLQIGGKQIWRSASFSPLSETTVVLVAHDITDRRQAEEALRRAEQRYRGLFEDAPAMYVITRNVEGSPVIADCNELFSRTLGFSRDELLERPLADFYSLASRAQLLEGGGYRRALAGQPVNEERELVRRDGRIVFSVVRTEPEVDATGQVSGTRAMFVDITERKQAEEELRRAKDALETAHRELQQLLSHEQLLARTDSLTGLCNRRHFFELAAREFSATMRYRHPLTLLMFDVDDFKQVNDILGHAIGDKVLALIAQAAAVQVRAPDVLARYGGDEFVLLLPQTSAQQALPIAERIRKSVAAMRVETDKDPLAVTLSIGIAEARREPPDESVDRVIQRADEALYKAKQSGRNRVVIFGQDETGTN